MNAKDYQSARIGHTVEIEEVSEITPEELACPCCGQMLRRVRFSADRWHCYYTQVTVRSWDVEEPERVMVEEFKAHDDCAADFVDAMKKGRAA